MRLIIEESGVQVAEQVVPAYTFLARLRGLLFRPPLSEGTCLHIRPCSAIHTYFMRYPIDVLYLDKHGRIAAAEWNVMPGRRGRRFASVHSVLEFRAGSLPRNELTEGRTLRFIEETQT